MVLSIDFSSHVFFGNLHQYLQLLVLDFDLETDNPLTTFSFEISSYFMQITMIFKFIHYWSPNIGSILYTKIKHNFMNKNQSPAEFSNNLQRQLLFHISMHAYPFFAG